jgi:hypothetical protein
MTGADAARRLVQLLVTIAADADDAAKMEAA